MVSPKLLQELQKIIKEDCGKNLKTDKVAEIGDGLVNLFEFLQEHRGLIRGKPKQCNSEKIS